MPHAISTVQPGAIENDLSPLDLDRVIGGTASTIVNVVKTVRSKSADRALAAVDALVHS